MVSMEDTDQVTDAIKKSEQPINIWITKLY